MLWIVFQALCVILIWHEVHAKGKSIHSFYTVVAPGTLRSNFKYSLVLTLHAADSNCRFRLGIKGPSYDNQFDIEMRPMTSKLVEFKLPNLEIGDYKLHVQGVSGLIFKNQTKLLYAPNTPIAYLQTNKEIYRAGELIRYWLILINEKLQGADAELAMPLLVLLTDSAGNVVQQLQNVSLVNGVYNGEYKLPTQVVAGHWQIVFSSGEGEFIHTKDVEVSDGSQPKFIVAFEMPKAVAIQNGTVRITLRARYSFGLAVFGRAVVTLAIKRSKAKNLTQTFEFHGKQAIEFDISSWQAPEVNLKGMNIVQLHATVEERSTHSKQIGYAEFKLYKERFRIQIFQVPFTYRVGVPLIYRLGVSTVCGEPLTESKSKVQLMFEQPIQHVSKHATELGVALEHFEPLSFVAHLDEEGVASFVVLVNYSLPGYLKVRAIFENISMPLSSLKHDNSTGDVWHEQIKLRVLTKRPRLNEDLNLRVSTPSTLGMPYLVYNFIARGNILKSQLVLLKGQQGIDLKFKIVSEMLPSLAIFIYFINNGTLVFQETIVHIEKEFKNFLKVSVPQYGTSGSQVHIGVKTMPGSVLGIAAFDYGDFWQRSQTRLNKEEIFKQLEHYTTTTPVSLGLNRYPGFLSGLVTMTNAHYNYENSPIDDEMLRVDNFDGDGERIKFGQNSLVNTPKLFEYVGATWLWHFEARIKTNNMTIIKKLPDITTSWFFIAFSLHPSAGLAVLDGMPKMLVKSDVIVTCEYPHMLRLGEIARLSIYMVNNVETSYKANATLRKSFGFDWLPQYSNTQLTLNETSPQNDPQINNGLYLIIRAKKLGLFDLIVTIRTQLTSSRIHLSIQVKAVGIASMLSDIAVIQLSESERASGELSLKVPMSLATLSMQHVQLSAIGDMLGPAINRMKELLRPPTTGDTKQRLTWLAQCIAVMQYLEGVHKLKPSIRRKAIEFIKLGRQGFLRQQTTSQANNILLTAQFLLCMMQGASYVPVSPHHMLKSLSHLENWLAGMLSDSAKVSFLEDKTVTELAFVLMAFHEAKRLTSQYNAINAQGVHYLVNTITACNKPYSLAISAYVLQLNKHPKATLLLHRLDAKAHRNSEQKWIWWTDDNYGNQTQFSPRLSLWRPKLDVRITAYTLMAQLEAQLPTKALVPIVSWLLAQRDHTGGYAKPQDTVIGLRALAKFAQRIATPKGVSNVSLNFALTSPKSSRPLSLEIDSANFLLLQTVTLPSSTRRVTYIASGQGIALLELKGFYHSMQLAEAAWFDVAITANYTNAHEQDQRELSLKVCIQYTPPMNDFHQLAQSSAFLKIALPSGFVADTAQIESINHLPWIAHVHLQDVDTLVLVKTQFLSTGTMNCLYVVVENTFLVAQQRLAYVHVYDVNTASHAGLAFYSIRNSICSICTVLSCFAQCNDTKML